MIGFDGAGDSDSKPAAEEDGENSSHDLVQLQSRFRAMSYISSRETSNLCTYAFGRGAQTA
jgi:hypothetical protein